MFWQDKYFFVLFGSIFELNSSFLLVCFISWIKEALKSNKTFSYIHLIGNDPAIHRNMYFSTVNLSFLNLFNSFYCALWFLEVLECQTFSSTFLATCFIRQVEEVWFRTSTDEKEGYLSVPSLHFVVHSFCFKLASAMGQNCIFV